MYICKFHLIIEFSFQITIFFCLNKTHLHFSRKNSIGKDFTKHQQTSFYFTSFFLSLPSILRCLWNPVNITCAAPEHLGTLLQGLRTVNISGTLMVGLPLHWWIMDVSGALVVGFGTTYNRLDATRILVVRLWTISSWLAVDVPCALMVDLRASSYFLGSRAVTSLKLYIINWRNCNYSATTLFLNMYTHHPCNIP